LLEDSIFTEHVLGLLIILQQFVEKFVLYGHQFPFKES
jgi:hypothetical protein